MTEKERRLWEKIGREVGEFKIGDAYKFADGDWGVVIGEAGCQSVRRYYDNGQLAGLLPTESYVDFGEIVSFGEGEA